MDSHRDAGSVGRDQAFVAAKLCLLENRQISYLHHRSHTHIKSARSHICAIGVTVTREALCGPVILTAQGPAEEPLPTLIKCFSLFRCHMSHLCSLHSVRHASTFADVLLAAVPELAGLPSMAHMIGAMVCEVDKIRASTAGGKYNIVETFSGCAKIARSGSPHSICSRDVTR
jgi:hypothetical protein